MTRWMANVGELRNLSSSHDHGSSACMDTTALFHLTVGKSNEMMMQKGGKDERVSTLHSSRSRSNLCFAFFR